jgi:hypothetical protein
VDKMVLRSCLSAVHGEGKCKRQAPPSVLSPREPLKWQSLLTALFLGSFSYIHDGSVLNIDRSWDLIRLVLLETESLQYTYTTTSLQNQSVFCMILIQYNLRPEYSNIMVPSSGANAV